MKRLLSLLLLIFVAGIFRSTAQTASFNFSLNPQSVSGWVNVHGDPSDTLITGTAPSGISVSSVGATNWSRIAYTSDPCAYDNGGASGGTFFPSAVMLNHWFQYGTSTAAYNALLPQLIISGLNVDSVYTIKMTGSFVLGIPQYYELNPNRYTVMGTINYGYIDIDGDSNTTAGAVFHNIAPDSTGKVRIFVNTYGGSNVASICGLQVTSGHTSGVVPSVSLTKPTNATILPEDANVAINATATETGGTIAEVQFYANGSLIGVDSAAPYSMTWNDPDPGTYTITARAIDGTGAITTSTANITIESLNYFWSTTGNIATGGDSNFVGTVDTNRLAFRTNNIERMSINKNGTVMVGTTNAVDTLAIHGNVTIQDSANNQGPLNINVNSTNSPFINFTNANPAEGASIGLRFYNANGLVSQMIAGSPTYYWMPNGFLFHDLSGGGFDFVMPGDSSFVSWGSWFHSLGGSQMIFYPHTGHLIIGSMKDSGNNKLQVNGTTWTTAFMMPTGASAGYVLTSDGSGNATWQPGGGGRWQYANGTVYDSTDNIAIGTSNPQGYKLAVNGTGIFTKIIAKPEASWPDYVFDKSYKLPSLQELAQYIREHHHLPDVTAEAEIVKNGIDLGEQQTTLLKKVEELTLYLIRENQSLSVQTQQLADQNKQLTDQNRQLNEQNARLEAQQKEIDELKALIQANHKQ